MARGTYQPNYWQNQIDQDEKEIREAQTRMQASTEARIRQECAMIIDMCESHIAACQQQINFKRL